MILRELQIDLSAQEYDMLLKPILGTSNYKKFLRRIQPYVPHNLHTNRVTRGIRIHITDITLMEYCLRYMTPPADRGGNKRFKTLEAYANLRRKHKRSTDEKDRSAIVTVPTGS
jgi:sugar diacid utilization regulator